MTMTFGTMLFSLTPDWRSGADTTTILERVAAADCGPAVEVIGHQAWRGFPCVSVDDERAFLDATQRLELTPAALGVYTDLFRRPGRPMSDDEAFDDVRPQLEAAARLGFPVVRATIGMTPGLLRRAAAECERLGVVLTFEVQGTTAPDSPAVTEVLALQAATGSPYLGLTIDFSLTTEALPAAFATALQKVGVSDAAVVEIHQAWQADGHFGARLQAAFAAVDGWPEKAGLKNLIAGIFGRTGRSRPADWAEILPLVRHAHAKLWDPDVEAVRGAHGAWLEALSAAGYEGVVLSEWGGHELLDRADADALTITRAHLDLLAELARPSTVAVSA